MTHAGPGAPVASAERVVALLGNPNTGKTTLFNALCGLRHKTSNFPGTTQEIRVGRARAGAGSGAGESPALDVVDLPGVYALGLDQPESRLCRTYLTSGAEGLVARHPRPDVALVVLDATNLGRNLAFLGEVLREGLATVVAVNLIDEARSRGLVIDLEGLSRAIGCPVVACSGRTREGLAELASACATAAGMPRAPEGDLSAWGESLAARVVGVEGAGGRGSAGRAGPSLGDRLDGVLTSPTWGLAVFALVMGGLFYAIFRLATYPMDWIDLMFARLSAWLSGVLPAGLLSELLVDGVVAGVGSTLVFLPQICLLFFLISLLEDTGYLARAALVVDRVLRPFGLSGHAFVPMLSSHACALPGLIACRGIPDARERLAAQLVAPFMSCSARIPVYAMLTVMLFPDSPWRQSLAFAGCYALGIAAAAGTALLVRRTILRGGSRAMAIELPRYRRPQVVKAAVLSGERGLVFLKKAGTVILAVSVVLWWLNAFPRGVGTGPTADEPPATYLERLGGVAQPIFEPLGYDRTLTIGVLASLAAREVFVATVAVQVTGEEEGEGVMERVRQARRADGSALFTTATCLSLLVYYVLAMQCLATLVVTARESGGWRWAALQLGWMTGVAYLAALAVYQGARALGHA